MRSRSRSVAGGPGTWDGMGGSSRWLRRQRMRVPVRLSGPPRTGNDRGMTEPNGPKKLIRPREGRMVAGVCAGLGDYFGIDANIVRAILAGLVLFGGFGALIDVVAWAVVPEEGEDTSIVENLINKNRK